MLRHRGCEIVAPCIVDVFDPVAGEQLCPVRGDAFCRALAD
ncbi:hypothetical protein [Azospirillum endophyticum]